MRGVYMNNLFTFMRESSTARFFIPAGIALIVFGVVVFVINSKNQNYIKIEATVSNVTQTAEAYTDSDGNWVEATYNAEVKYVVADREYTETLDNVSKFDVGDKVTIYYNPNNPQEITQTKSLIVPIIMVGLGIASLTGGIISAVNVVKKHKKMKEQERSWANE
jgi:hypothetical protein